MGKSMVLLRKFNDSACCLPSFLLKKTKTCKTRFQCWWATQRLEKKGVCLMSFCHFCHFLMNEKSGYPHGRPLFKTHIVFDAWDMVRKSIRLLNVVVCSPPWRRCRVPFPHTSGIVRNTTAPSRWFHRREERWSLQRSVPLPRPTWPLRSMLGFSWFLVTFKG